MVNRSKAKGTQFETLVTDFLRLKFPHARRATLTGNIDRGDVTGVPGLTVQCKNQKSVSLGAWVDASKDQAANACADFAVVVHKRVGKANASEQFATMPLGDFARLYAAYVKMARDLDAALDQ